MRFLKTAKEYNKVSGLPKEYQEVEYLQSSGTQYIDTGYKFTSEKAQVQFGATVDTYASDKSICGSNNLEADTNYGFVCYLYNNGCRVYLGSTNTGSNTTIIDGNYHTFDLSANNGTATKIIDGTTTTASYNGSIISTGNFVLFTNYKNATSSYLTRCYSGKIYYFKIWDNGVLVRDMIPCLDSSGKPCMYDLVEGKPYYNLGTDADFTYGKRITAIEYIQSTGTQYIDTGLKGKNGYDFAYKFNSKIDDNAYGIGGEWESGKSCYFGVIRNNNKFAYHYKDTSSPIEVQTLVNNTDYEVQAHLYAGEQYYVINGTKSTIGTISGTFTSTVNMCLFAVNSSTTKTFSNLKMYFCKIWDDGTLIRDYIPVRDENNVGYMLDKVSHTLYANGGTGTFTLGDDLPSKKVCTVLFPKENNSGLPAGLTPVEYLHADGAQWIDTGLISTNKSVVDVSFGFDTMESGTANNCAIFGGRNNTTMTTFTLFKLATGNPQYFRFDYNGQNTIGTANNLTWNTASIYRFQYDGTDMTSSNVTTGESTSTTKIPATSFTSRTICLFGVNYTNGVEQFMKGRIYHYYYSDGTNTIDLIPVLDKNGKPAMYDRIGNQLYYNQGSGADFTTGPKIYPVEYLQSSGTQYIDTGYAFTDGFSWEIDFEGISDGCTLFGGRTSSTRTALLYQRNYGGIDKTTCPIAGYNGQETPFQLEDLRVGRHKIKMAVASNKGSVWVDGTQVYNEQSFTGTYISGTTQALFADKFGNNDYREQTSSKVYALKMWQGITLVRDYIPVVNENGVGYLLDKISNTVYSNRGTGDFTYGKKTTLHGRMLLDSTSPKYKVLKCLKTTGTQYINANYNVGNAVKYEFIAKFNETTTVASYKGIFGTSQSGNSARSGMGFYNGKIRAQWGNGSASAGTNYYDSSYTGYNKATRYELSRQGFYINGTLDWTPGVDINALTSVKIWVMNTDAESLYPGTSMNMYAARIYDDSVLVRDFIPVLRKSDKKPGMLDRVHNVFYTNAGTDEFEYEL